jgi:hypothetical protein
MLGSFPTTAPRHPPGTISSNVTTKSVHQITGPRITNTTFLAACIPTMALAEALALWDIPTTSLEGARRYQQVGTVSLPVSPATDDQAQDIARAYIFPQDIRGASKSSASRDLT